ncbi:uncharacterized protein LOC116123878 [Pistacia vera]|uniref:uncharacterized protein LOC116123878 n=1 Tax=Pistacia vera TaxID=55513 RepID=UPI001262D821|nr:uncharacterized protein LOC116123878 [Pistacia vera]
MKLRLLMLQKRKIPTYANLSGWSTKGAMACPSCNEEIPSTRLKYGCKFSFMGARRFLPMNHKWRENKSSFDGKLEKRSAPKKMSGDDMLNQLQMLQPITFGKAKKKQMNDKNQNSIIGTLLDIEGKTKDNLNARRDLKEMGIRKDLHPTQKDGKWFYSATCYTLSLEEKTKICKFLKSVKVPDGYSSNISRCVSVKECKINRLKNHDSHILLEQLLPMAMRGIVPNNVYDAITELSIFFRELCSKVLKKEALERLESQIVITLCKLERIFPPTFFDVMVHLTVHLATEAKIVGPVQYRWMYPIERFLGKLKRYVCNKSRPKGSIAEGEHEQGMYQEDFHEWFHHQVVQLYKEESTCVNEVLLSLSCGTFYGIQRFSGYIINGFRFHTKQLEGKRVKQNSGVLVKGMVEDKNIDYYGVLNEIIELQYLNEKRIVLFKCDWWDVHVIGRGVKNDKYGFVSVNTTRKLYTDEPFVLASQAQQICYVNDGSNPNWLVVLKGHSDSFYDLPCGEKSSIDEEAFQQDISKILLKLQICLKMMVT